MDYLGFCPNGDRRERFLTDDVLHRFNRIDLNIDQDYDSKVFIDRLGQTRINDLMEYCWLFMRTAIFLKNLER